MVIKTFISDYRNGSWKIFNCKDDRDPEQLSLLFKEIHMQENKVTVILYLMLECGVPQKEKF